MNALEQILHRRSIRRYKPEMPSRELIEKITEAGTYAACGRNLQSGLIIAVTNRELRDRISAMNNQIWGGEEGFDPFYGAPAILIVLAKKDLTKSLTVTNPRRSLQVTCRCRLQTSMMWFCIRLSTGCIHRAKEEFESEEGKQILRDLGITEEYEGIGHLALGYPEGAHPVARPRKENYVYFAE